MLALTPMDRARTALENGQRFPEAAVPAPIAESWRRSLGFGLDTMRRAHELVLPFAEVARRRERASDLRALALAEMQTLYAQIAGSHFMIAFADPEGVVLDTFSDSAFAESEAGRTVLPGSVWGEAVRGTNALGLAAALGAPAAVYGREHFFAAHGGLSCMAAPILDPSGALVGLIDASCAHEARQQHTHALVKMAAVQIENGMMFRTRPELYILAFHPRAEFLDTLSAGLVAVSGDGDVVSLNRAGRALLAGLPAERGTGFSRLFAREFGETLSEIMAAGVARLRDRAGAGLYVACRQVGKRARPRSEVARAPRNGFVAEDPRVASSLRDLESALALRMPIHITGETGTGKELMARHVHEVSRRAGPFVAVNCGALPESLFIAELFGHERGAFTHARAEGAPGLARQADKGVLFLDEVADIPLEAQTSLLRFLDSGEARPLGGRATIKLDVQIVSATNRNLAEAVAAKSFRRDLLHRLNAFTIELPPLRLRADFNAIVRRLVNEIAPDAAITDAAIETLSQRSWSGNIRELRSVLQRALIRRRMGFLDETSFDLEANVDRVCPSCRGSARERRFCEEIATTHEQCNRNVTQTALKLRLSRTTVYKHLAR